MPEGDLGPAEKLDRSYPSNGPEISVRDLGMIVLHNLKKIPDDAEPLVVWV